MSDYETIAEVQNRINSIYKENQIFLSDTSAQTSIEAFLAIENPIITDLDNLRISLDNYQTSLTNQFTLANAVNSVLMSTENEYLFQRIGYTTLSNSATQESFNGGVSYSTSITSLIGPYSINDVTPYDDNTITGLIGDEEIQQMTIAGTTSSPATSISDGMNKITNLLSLKIGTSALAFTAGVTLNQCTTEPSILGGVIYEMPDPLNIVAVLNGIRACSIWASNSETYGITITGNVENCQMFTADLAFSNCIALL